MNLLITGAWQQAPVYIPLLEQQGHAVCFLQQERDPLPCAPGWVEGIICNGLFASHDIAQFHNLKYIQLTSAGLDRVPMDYVMQHGITIRNARGVYSIPMAEFAMAGVLEIYKQTNFFRRNQQLHRWEKRRDLRELCGKQVCILGCGDIGGECASRFAAFGCHVIGINRTVRQDDRYERIVSLDRLEELLPAADILILTLPLNAETRGILNASRLKLLKPGCILVNLARGGLVDTDALLEALPNLGGAVLDVFDPEPLAEDSPLWDLENVIITPHNSFVGEQNAERMANVILDNLKESWYV